MASGASAVRNDRVRNLITGLKGTVTGSSQFGRILVLVDNGGVAKWERFHTEIIQEGV